MLTEAHQIVADLASHFQSAGIEPRGVILDERTVARQGVFHPIRQDGLEVFGHARAPFPSEPPEPNMQTFHNATREPIEFELRNVQMVGASLTGTAMVRNLQNKRFPRLNKNYDYVQFPSLLP